MGLKLTDLFCGRSGDEEGGVGVGVLEVEEGKLTRPRRMLEVWREGSLVS